MLSSNDSAVDLASSSANINNVGESGNCLDSPQVGGIDFHSIVNAKAVDFAWCTNRPDVVHYDYISMDVGSTEQRVCTHSLNLNEQSDVLFIDTEYAILNHDDEIAACSSVSASIMDNLEMHIRCLAGNSAAIQDLHIVKGSLMRRTGRTGMYMTREASKVSSVETYCNILTNLAVVALCVKLFRNESMDIPVAVDLSVSMPPDDSKYIGRINNFKSRLEGVYEIEFVRLKQTVTIILNPDRIRVFSEPVASAVAQLMEPDFQIDATCAFVDCGGRSGGVVVMQPAIAPDSNANLMEGSVQYIPWGGSSLLSMIAEEVANTFEIPRPGKHQLIRVLTTGIYYDGAKRIFITGVVNRAKQRFAQKMFTELTEALSEIDVLASDLAYIYCTGRVFCSYKCMEGEVEVTSPSLVEYLNELYKTRSPMTRFEYSTDRSTIVRGVMCYRYNLALNEAEAANVPLASREIYEEVLEEDVPVILEAFQRNGAASVEEDGHVGV